MQLQKNYDNITLKDLQDRLYRKFMKDIRYLGQTDYEKLISFCNDNYLIVRESHSKDTLSKFITVSFLTKDNYMCHVDFWVSTGKLFHISLGRKVNID